MADPLLYSSGLPIAIDSGRITSISYTHSNNEYETMDHSFYRRIH